MIAEKPAGQQVRLGGAAWSICTNSSVSGGNDSEMVSPSCLAGGFKLDIGNPIALAPAQARLFILALEGCGRAPEQRKLYVLECVDADDGIQAAVDSAGDHRHHATGGAHVKLGSLGSERVF
jgi:hypothetical protein